jgi:large subunit ribosomal protein L25
LSVGQALTWPAIRPANACPLHEADGQRHNMKEDRLLEFIDLKAKTRQTRGNSPARKLRREGQTPAVLYGPGSDPTPLAVNTHELELVLKASQAGQVFVNLDIEAVGARQALLKELQRHPVKGTYIHADFYEIDLNRKIHVKVPVTTRGQAKGVELGGMLQIIRRELEVHCVPHSIPESIEIDITDLDIGESVHVEELPLGPDVEIPHEVNFTVLTILSGRMAEGAEEGEAAAGEIEEATEAADEEEEA